MDSPELFAKTQEHFIYFECLNGVTEKWYTLFLGEDHPVMACPHPMLAGMQRHLEQGNGTLPVVIPLLFYLGTRSPYPYRNKWFDCFADPELAESVYSQAFPLVDITAMLDDEMLQHRRVALLKLRNMSELTGDIAHLLNLWGEILKEPVPLLGVLYRRVEKYFG
ncbi:Rpn family recombination-promoting nuclease/putative transposase [Candidatus Sodalis pierantonius]|uniref:Rpn family recombination-promoting nuclease/putative transposase n=1 Tax=Candidatus Sodalis pierantonii TaxID=1486991 RepID=UPI0006864C46